MPGEKPPPELVIASGLSYIVDKQIPDVSDIYAEEKTRLEVRQQRIEVIHTQLKTAIEQLEKAAPEENVVAQNVYE